MSSSRSAALLRVRLIWAALLISQIVYGGVVLSQRGSESIPTVRAPTEIYGIISWTLLVTSVVVAAALRTWLSRKALARETVPPERWVVVQITSFALLEAASLASLTFSLVTGELRPFVLVAGAAMLVQLVCFPLFGPATDG